MAARNLPPARQYGSVQSTPTSRLLSPSPRDNLEPDGAFEVEEDSRAVSPYGVIFQRGSGTKRWISVAATCALGVGALMAAVRAGSSPVNTSVPQQSGTDFFEKEDVGDHTVAASPRPGLATAGYSMPPIGFTAVNFYHVRDGKPAQDYPWLQNVKLLEPHRETTLAVVDARDGYDYRWEIRSGEAGNKGTLLATATGTETMVVVTQLEENSILLEEVSPAGDVTRRLEETVMVKYVRREIRTLTDEEREELLDSVGQTYCCGSTTVS